MNQLVYLCVNVSSAVIDDFVVCTLADFVLRPLTIKPLKCFLAGDAVALHDTLKPKFFGGSNHHDLVDEAVGT